MRPPDDSAPSCGYPVVASATAPQLRPGNWRLPHKAPGLYDLPYPVREDALTATLDSEGEELSVTIDGLVPFPDEQLLRQFDRQQSPASMTEEQRRQLMLYNLIDNLVGVFDELRWVAEQKAEETDDWFTTPRPVLAPLPWQEVHSMLQAPGEELRMDLIGKIASNFDTVLFKLAASPHKVLHRQRQRQHLSRVQQLDAACLSWLTRQPGISAAQKAGARQEILAVTRIEGYDTMENRVLKDMLRRCRHAARLSLHQNRAHADKARYRMVQRFDQRCGTALQSPVFAGIHNLTGVPQPNYVLLHDTSYREMWHWYLRLVKRETATLDAWRWQHRLWADVVRLMVCSCLSSAAVRSPAQQYLWLRESATTGNWIESMDWPGPVLIDDGRAVVEAFCPATMPKGDYFGLPLADWATASGADLLLLVSNVNGSAQRCVFVWAIHSPQQSPDDGALAELAKLAESALARIGTQIATGGLIIANDCFSVAESAVSRAGTGEVQALRVSGQPDQWLDAVGQAITWT
tara:strand:- start:14200 stop:15759 length:1560 start_codon:yes stop_codon:yes gene_type:complete